MGELWAEMERWQIRRVARRVIGPRTAARQRQKLRRFCDFVGPTTPAREVTEETFERWLVELAMSVSSFGRPYEASSINQIASPVRAFFAHEARRGVIPADPCIDVPRLPEDPIEPRSLPPETLDRLIAGCSGPTGFRDQTLIVVCALTGLRAAELAQMRVEMWNRDRQSMVIRRAKTKRVQEIHFAPQVTEQLSAWVRFGLSAWLLQATVPTYGPMWPGEKHDNAGLRPGSIGAIVRHVAADADVRANLHALRHSFVHGLFGQGVSANVVQAAAGHESLATTGRYAKAHDAEVMLAVRQQRRIGGSPAD